MRNRRCFCSRRIRKKSQWCLSEEQKKVIIVVIKPTQRKEHLRKNTTTISKQWDGSTRASSEPCFPTRLGIITGVFHPPPLAHLHVYLLGSSFVDYSLVAKRKSFSSMIEARRNVEGLSNHRKIKVIIGRSSEIEVIAPIAKFRLNTRTFVKVQGNNGV